MVDQDCDRALQRIDAALARLEASVHRINQAGPADAASGALTSLQTRHHALREAVRQGLGQLDGLLADMGSHPASGGSL